MVSRILTSDCAALNEFNHLRLALQRDPKHMFSVFIPLYGYICENVTS